jgi:hypothetical protein
MTKRKLEHFLLVYDHEAGELLEELRFGADSDAAVAAYSEKEQEYKDRKKLEIVLIGSDSLETVKITHANYYERDPEGVMSRFLEDIYRMPERHPVS